jgi:hypothetical protein
MSYIGEHDFGLEAARGRVPGVATLNKFGRAQSGVQTTSTDIWSRADAAATQQIWVAPTTARVHAIVSTSASDAAAGVGARTVRIQGLTAWNTAEATETVTLNGTTPVNTVNSYVIIHRMKVLTCGATDINVGTISATAATDGTITAIISPSQGQTQMAIYGVPSTQSLYMTRFYAYMNDPNASTRVDAQLRVNDNPDVQLTNFINKFDLQLFNSGSSTDDISFNIPIKFSGPCIIKVQAIANIADVDMSAGFDGYLVTN